MTTAEILNQMEKEFEKKWCKDKSSGFISPFCHIDDIYEFASKLSRTLLESFGEEIIGESENISGSTDYRISWGLLGRNKLKAEQRLKVKEILEVIK